MNPSTFYPEVFNQFLKADTTRGNINRDFSEWHLGRNKYFLWGISITSEKIDARFVSARKQLFEYLLSPYFRQPHITLFVCGFLTDQVKNNDDYSQEQLDFQIGNLGSKNLKPFEIEIGGINSFSISPFLEVRDTISGINRIRNALSIDFPENRQEKFVPHITFGLYSGDYSTKHIAEKFVDLGPSISIRIERISLLSFDPTKINGALKTEKVFWLK